jgi:4-hydroxybenzoate polyprenyltransferase
MEPLQCSIDGWTISGDILVHGSAPWIKVFWFSAYAMAAGCIFGAARRAYKTPRPVIGIATQLAIFVTFGVLLWGLESLAHFRSPYYVYAPEFRDGLPRFTGFPDWIGKAGLSNRCTSLVRCLQRQPPTGTIPLSVILLEASLAYSAMWTARLLGGKLWSRALLAGLVLVNVDILLDPVVAQSHGCGPDARSSTLATTPESGLGFWHWYVPQAIDRFKDSGEEVKQNLLSAWWFHIPVFNYVAWLSAPVILTFLVTACSGLRDLWQARTDAKRLKALGKEVGAVLGIFLFVAALLHAAPNFDASEIEQNVIFAVELGATMLVLVWHFMRTKKTLDRADYTLMTPTALGLLVPAAAAVLSGRALHSPALMPVVLVTAPFGLWLVLLPYHDALKKVAEWIGQVDAYTRLHYFGFTAMLVFLGGGLAQPKPTLLVTLALLVIAASFHLFAYLHNDHMDAWLDKHVQRRSGDPLQNGDVSDHTSVGVYVTAVPVAVAALVHLCGFDLRPSNNYLALSALLASFGLMAFYNVYGKRCPWPLVTDAVEGLSWGLLSFAATLATNYSNGQVPLYSTLPSGAFSLALYGALYILLINGIHGGLRDYVTDSDHKQQTTAIWFGADKDPKTGEPRSNSKIASFAFAVLIGMFAVLANFVAQKGPKTFYGDAVYDALCAGLVALFVLNALTLWGVVKPVEADRPLFISLSLLLLLLPVMAVFLCADAPSTAFKWTVVCSFGGPLLLRRTMAYRAIALFHQPGGPSQQGPTPLEKHPPPDTASAAQ